ncbi:MAG TPA: DUF2127 domain-containing protein [Steroidobacteraceae bacterium]|nr:DUF2127 domain-containing protein [Steroidobacteraceae bacterium]
MTTPAEKALKPRFGVLRTIALYKLVKVMLLLGVAYGELRLRDASLAAKLLSWAQARPYGLEHRIVGQLLEWFGSLSVSRIHALRIVTLAYAAVFAIEGIGLWLEKRWAEWLTTIITASLIPLEAWEIILRPTIGKVLILLANVAVVAYLVWHVRKTQALRQTPIVK